jgi:hypothetical protein
LEKWLGRMKDEGGTREKQKRRKNMEGLKMREERD